MKGSPRRDELLRLLKLGPKSSFELEAGTGLGMKFIREELSRLKAQGRVDAVPCDKWIDGRFVKCIYSLVDEALWRTIAQRIKRSPAHVIRVVRRKRTPTGSGQFAAPCISRSYKWNRGAGIAF